MTQGKRGGTKRKKSKEYRDPIGKRVRMGFQGLGEMGG